MATLTQGALAETGLSKKDAERSQEHVRARACCRGCTTGRPRAPSGSCGRSSPASPTSPRRTCWRSARAGTTARRPRRSPTTYEVAPAADFPPGTLPADHREHRAGVRDRRRGPVLGAAGVPRQLPDHAGVGHPARAVQAQELQRHDDAGRGRDRRRRGGARRGLRRLARRHDDVRAGHRAEVGDDRARGDDRSCRCVVIDVQRGGPSTGLPTKTEQADLLQAMFGRNGESPVPIVAPQSPGDCFARRDRGDADRADVPDAGAAAVRRRDRERLGAVADPGRRRPAGPARSRSRPSRTRSTAAASTGPTSATPRRSPASGPSRARPVCSTASAGWRRPTARAASPTTRTTTTAWSGCVRPKWTVSTCRTWRSTTRPGARGVLVLGWGSTLRADRRGVPALRGQGIAIAQAHLRHLNPFPANLGAGAALLRPGGGARR